MAWGSPLRRQPWCLQVVWRPPPRGMPALLTRRVGSLLRLHLLQHSGQPLAVDNGRVPGSGVGAVGKWPAVATVQSLAEAGHLSTAVVIACLR